MAVGNEVRIVVDADNKTAQAFGSAAKGTKTVGDAAEVAAKQLAQMDEKLEAANVKARKLAEAEERAAAKARDMALKLAGLRQQLAESGDESGKLGRKIDRLTIDTKSAAEATDDYRRKANRAADGAREQARAYDRVAANAREAARAVAILGAASLLSPAGKGGGAGAGGMLPSLLSAGGGIGAGGAAVGAAGAGVAISAAPFIGGVIGGSALAGAGAAAAGAGLAGAWMGDPEKYQAMWDTAINGIQQRWLSSSKQFGGPLEDSLNEIDRVLRDLPVERLANASKDFVAPLVRGAGGGITELANGFADLVEAAGPVVDVVGPKLVELGRSGGDAMRSIAEGADGSALAIGDFIDVVGFAVEAAGALIGGLGQAYEAQRKLWSAAKSGVEWALPDVLDESNIKLSDFETIANNAARAAEEWARKVDEAATGVAGLSANLEAMRGNAMRMKDAELDLAQGWFDLNEELKDGKKTLDLNTEAGIENQRAIESQIGAAQRAYEQGKLTDAQYAESIERIKAMAIALGFDAAQVDNLVNSLAVVQPITQAEVKTPGLAESLNQGISLGNALNNIDGRYYYAHVDLSYTSHLPQGISLGNLLRRTGGPTGAATGGVHGGLTEVGEEGRELVRLPTGSGVYPHANTEQMRTMESWGGGSQAPAPILLGSDGSRLGDLLIDLIAVAMRSGHGGRPEALGLKIQTR